MPLPGVSFIARIQKASPVEWPFALPFVEDACEAGGRGNLFRQPSGLPPSPEGKALENALIRSRIRSATFSTRHTLRAPQGKVFSLPYNT